MTTDGYGTAALEYWTLGWKCPLPLPRGQKKSPPPGRTGYSGEVPSYPDIIAWGEDYPTGNLALRMPPTVIGIDVDHYDGKQGGLTLKHAEQLWGELPATVRTTSRDDDQSGIRLYRVPEGTRLRTVLSFPDEHLGDVEIVQYFHRYAIAWPSIHPSGQQYRWLDEADQRAQLPNVAGLPDLPPRWLDALAAKGSDVELSGQIDIQQVIDRMPAGPPSGRVSERLTRAICDLEATPDSRHDTTMRHALALLRFAEQGEPGVADALSSLGGAFVNVVSRPGQGRTTSEAQSEFVRMITNQRGLQLIEATPSVEIDLDQASEIVAAREEPAAEDPGPPPEDRAAELTDLDAAFWGARETLATVYAWAHGRYTSPWSALGVVLCRALATVPPWITLPPIVGGPGSLNLFVALVGPSGSGKGASASVAAAVLPTQTHTAKLGSGEGLVKTFGRAVKEDGRHHVELIRQAAVFGVDEVDTIAGLGSRLGSTLMPALRSMYSGEALGFGYADPNKAVIIPAHQYRATMYVGVQPGRARALLDEADGGTPQRFVWLPTTDPRIGTITIEEPDFPPQLLPRENWGNTVATFHVPNQVSDIIRDNAIARARGEGDALDGHALFTREKVAAALAVLEGRSDMTIEDWDLSGVVMEMSDRTRRQVEQDLAKAAEAEAIAYGKKMGITADARDTTVDRIKIDRVRRNLLRALDRADGRTMTEGKLLNRINSRDRDVAPAALGELIVEMAVLYDPSDKRVSLPKEAGK
ncbi:bifunctional DNA primase/polymerase [Gordonia sp. (in: high G+C Gram-positive bacteria)]|uniref:bifunctional DNA primase/polymerase n=1 Tax=Gordonia sp. (in: high G+C Gram-positive bacteria) TaxID=84139 RepID=UPI0039E2F39B